MISGRPQYLTILTIFAFAMAIGADAQASDLSSEQADQVLSAAKQAMGGSSFDRVQTLTESGRLNGNNIVGTYSSVTDLRRVYGLQMTELGPMEISQGWDGSTAWSADGAGRVRIEKSKEAVSSAISTAYKAAYAFFWPERWPATRGYVGLRSLDGATFDVIRVEPSGSHPIELWIDHTTHLILRETDVGGQDPHTQTLSDYREVGALKLPFSSKDTNGVAQYDMLASTGTLTADGAPSAIQFGPPASQTAQDPFPPGVDSVTLPIRLDNNHILLDASIDGRPPATFIFDTGGVAILDEGVAARYGMKPTGALPAGGFGEGTTTIGLLKAASLTLGGFKLKSPVVLTMQLAEVSKASGQEIAGIVGYEVAQAAVVTIDYEKRQLTLTKRSAFKPPIGTRPLPLKFNEHHPMVQASVDGIGAEFDIDTGSASGLLIMGPFAAANDLARKFHATTTVVAGQGAGGQNMALLGRAHQLKLGDALISKPVALIDTGKRGAGAAALTGGNIGGAMLRRFTVTFDYGGQALYLVPNSDFGSADEFDRSGMRLNRSGDGTETISFVVAGSAADRAGLKIGDRIVAIDGIVSRDIALTDLRDRFKSSTGGVIRLTVAPEQQAARDVLLRPFDLTPSEAQ